MADNFIGRMLGAIVSDTEIIGEIEDQLKEMGEGEFRENGQILWSCVS